MEVFNGVISNIKQIDICQMNYGRDFRGRQGNQEFEAVIWPLEDWDLNYRDDIENVKKENEKRKIYKQPTYRFRQLSEYREGEIMKTTQSLKF